ncbi:MAG: hypothetical protein NZN28_04205 [Meiothermus sp.]|uniref:hypothetical protein n=1 Tax=Meiothermus sp. TaxID=1955249 RepID=UPI0025E5A720|nr:hypothetical protein [Meiothermus sp.]MCS7067825.1 hypothetical protein [Meiothermus sp.]
MSIQAIVLLVGLVAFAVLGLFLMIAGAARQNRRLAEALKPLGFQSDNLDKALVTQKFSLVTERFADTRATVTTLFKKHTPDHTLYICNYHPRSASGRATGSSYWLVGALDPNLDLPRFAVEPVPTQGGLLGKMLRTAYAHFSVPGLQKIPTGFPGFDQRFYVYAPPGLSASALMSANVMQHLLSSGHVALEAKGDTLILSSLDLEAERKAKGLDPNKLIQLTALVQTLLAEFHNKGNRT